MTHGTPATSWWQATIPPTLVSISSGQWIGARIAFTVPGRLFGFRFYTDPSRPQWGLVGMWNTDGSGWVTASFFKQSGSTGRQWNQRWIRPTFRITVGTTYGIACLMTSAFFRTASALVAPVTHNGIQFISGFQSTAINPATAALTLNTNANGIDVLFQPD